MLFRILVVLFSLVSLYSEAQTLIKGTIKDKRTRQPVPSVTISLTGIPGAAVSNAEGHFQISTQKPVKNIRFSAIGYKTHEQPVPAGSTHHLHIELEENTNELKGVSILATKKARYSNKDNPAVELIRQVVAHRDQNRKTLDSTVVFRQYEKLNLSLSMAAVQVKKSSLLRKFPFLLKSADTSLQPGRALIPLFMRERLTMYQESKDHLNDKSQLLDEKQSRIDQYFDEDGIDEYLNQIYQPVDIYDHDIGLGAQKFLSPISSLAPQFYKYFIIDTLRNTTPYVVHLMFSPRNKQDQLFMGEMFIPLDGHYAVRNVSLNVNKSINLNWVNDLQVKIEYERDLSGKYYISKSTTAMDLGLFKGKDKNSVFGERTLVTTDYGVPAKDFIFPAAKPALAGPDTFKRPVDLSPLDQNAYNNIDSLKKSPKFKRMMAITALMISGYQKAGPIDIGPVSSFYSFNPVEGRRFRLSARTNEDFSDRFILEGHLAYGRKDRRWKHAMGVTYSFKRGDMFNFPVSTFTVRHSYETQIPGQDLNFLEDDNFLLSFKRGINDKWLYNSKWSGEYFQEMANHLSFRIGYRNQKFEPTGGLIFQPASGGPEVHQLQLSEFTSELRWAPHEQFYQGKRFRRPIKNGYPVFTLRATAGIKNFLGGDYSYQQVSMNISKRVYVSPFGYSDVVMEGGMVFGKVPFPLLAIHRANQTYAYQLQSYNLMNFMEFMSDRYASINIDHAFNGLVLNKIPLLKKLHLREVASFKALYGGISDKNRPENSPELYRFATDRQGVQTSFGLDKVPYMEGSVGISNIFKILRIDYVRRFNYLDHPHVPKWGIRARIHVDF